MSIFDVPYLYILGLLQVRILLNKGLGVFEIGKHGLNFFFSKSSDVFGGLFFYILKGWWLRSRLKEKPIS